MRSGEDAWQDAVRAHSSWEKTNARFQGGIVEVHHEPKFSLSREDAFFCMGSCFARNIEEHLIYRGLPVQSKRIVCPRSEWRARPNGLVNKFTTMSMLNEVRWALLGEDAAAIDGLVETEAGWTDLQLSPGVRPVSRERAIERRRYLVTDYFARIRQSSVLVLTLGLTEAWRDSAAGLYLNAAPSRWQVRRDRERYQFHQTSYEENLAALNELHSIVKACCGGIKFVVTVSPVPLSTTFSGLDVLVANTISKSTLRAVAFAFAAAHDNVDYYPAFEIVTNTPRTQAYGPDCLHVRDAVVAEVIERFFRGYLRAEAPALADGFAELLYLRANLDVDELVRAGILESGFAHWQATGCREGRPLRPDGDYTLGRAAGIT